MCQQILYKYLVKKNRALVVQIFLNVRCKSLLILFFLNWNYRASEPRTVVLHRGKKGFGFVLRGAKATSPLMERPNERGPALQYLDDVDPGGVADLAGLKKGDYLLRVSRSAFFLTSILFTFFSFLLREIVNLVYTRFRAKVEKNVHTFVDTKLPDSC